MSGGAHDYAYSKVNEFIKSVERDHETPGAMSNMKHWNTRKMFLQHLILVAEAMREIEWEDSGDTGPEDTDIAILRVLSDK